MGEATRRLLESEFEYTDAERRIWPNPSGERVWQWAEQYTRISRGPSGAVSRASQNNRFRRLGYEKIIWITE